MPANAKGVRAKGYPTQDGLRAANITFEQVEVGADAALGDAENALPLVERVVDEARIALCSEAVGAMDESLKMTMEYLKTRQQFGQNIGKFQALQHRGSDMFVALEQARGITMYGTMAVTYDDAKERSTAIAATKVQVGRSSEIHRPAVDPAAWRRRHDQGVQDRPLFQAADHDRVHLRRCRLSLAADCGAGRAVQELTKPKKKARAMTKPPFDLTGKVAVVTGSSRGIVTTAAV